MDHSHQKTDAHSDSTNDYGTLTNPVDWSSHWLILNQMIGNLWIHLLNKNYNEAQGLLAEMAAQSRLMSQYIKIQKESDRGNNVFR